MDVIQEYIDLEALPACIAPKDGKGKAMPGYFENVSLKGGPLDKTGQDTLIMKQGRTVLPKGTSMTSATESMRSNSERMEESNIVNVSTTVMMKGFWDVGSNRSCHSPVVTTVRS